MRFELERSGSIEALRGRVEALSAQATVGALVVLVAAADHEQLWGLDALCRDCAKPLMGAVFPQLVVGRERLERGAIVVALAACPRVTLVRGLDVPGRDLREQLIKAVAPEPADSTLLVFVDGLTVGISALISTLFELHGLEFNYLGGGGGVQSFERGPCVFTNEGVFQDAAVVVQLHATSGVGVAHGWHPVSGEFRVTGSTGTRLVSLDCLPAFDVYRKAVADFAGEAVDFSDLLMLARAYPFGFKKLGNELVVRDPVRVESDGSMTCVGELAEGALVQVLTGSAHSLREAAGAARRSAHRTLDVPVRDSDVHVLFCCISRKLYLEDAFDDELAEVDDGRPLFGALTIGEIANSGWDYLEFYNKTVVVGLLREGGGPR